MSSTSKSEKPSGSRMLVWGQEPSNTALGKRIVTLPQKVGIGPSDPQIEIAGFKVKPDANGDFVFGNEEGPYNEDESDAIHTYTIIRMVLNMYQGLLGKELKWAWNKRGNNNPVKVYLRYMDVHSSYADTREALLFGHYRSGDRLMYDCRSVDLVAHETGHALLDTLKPKWHSTSGEVQGLIEAFCDLTSMFLILSQLDLVEYILYQTEGDLSKRNILGVFGASHGFQNKELRSVFNNFTYQDELKNAYQYAQLVTSIFYNILAEYYYLVMKDQKIDRALLFYQCGQTLVQVTLNALLGESLERVNLKEIGLRMIELAEPSVVEIIKKQLRLRKVI